ncbi:receptor-like protein 12 isoform X2, partial [Thalictrum thalictroides]
MGIIRKTNVDYYDLLSFWGDEKDNDCCAWHGVHCNNSTGQVIQLSLWDIHWNIPFWSGIINDESLFLSAYEEFEQLDLSLNASLFLPFEELQQLDLSNNIFSDLNGFDVFLNLQKLEELVLESNNCDNRILSFMGDLKSLKMLDLSGNYLEGSLPEFSK